jgi:ribosomal protein L24E
MNRVLVSIALLGVAAAGSRAVAADQPARRSPREALQAFNDLIGSWRATGTPEGTREEKQRGFWTETVRWEWQFKDKDAWLKADFEKGKHFTGGTLRYLPEKDRFRLTLQTPGKETVVFEGPLDDRRLTLEREDEKRKETQRLVITLLHANRFLYRYEVMPQGKADFTRLYLVGATKEGVPFAEGDARPECVVSGGLGTIPVSYNGKTYFVCCSGCRAEFKENPEKYIKEYEERKKKEAKEKGR